METVYDSNARPIVSKLVAGSTVYALAQTNYDALGRVDCVARRMDVADFASSLPDACTLTAPAGSEVPDRITRSIYDPAGRVTHVITALGVTGVEAIEVTTTFTPNGQVDTVTDAENNKTTYEYDGHDRLLNTRYPLQAKGADASAPTSGLTADFEQSTYEVLAGGARTSGLVTAFRNRAGETTTFAYDALGRVILKDLPGAEPDSTFAYDLLGGLVSATRNGVTVAFTWDALGRQLTQTIPIPLVANPVFASEYDLAGRRTRLTWPVDASGPTPYHVDYDYLVTGEVAAIREKGATSGPGVLAVYGYDDLGRRTSLVRGNGAVTSYGYDAASRLSQMAHDFAGTAHDLTATYTYNPAGQIASTTRSNDLYAWTGTINSTCSSENLLTSFGASGPIEYDPLLRLYHLRRKRRHHPARL